MRLDCFPKRVFSRTLSGLDRATEIPPSVLSNFVNSCKSSDTKEVPRSERIVFGKKLSWKKCDVCSNASASALTFVKGTANKYFLKLSIIVNTK